MSGSCLVRQPPQQVAAAQSAESNAVAGKRPTCMSWTQKEKSEYGAEFELTVGMHVFVLLLLLAADATTIRQRMSDCCVVHYS
jgi:hypothetical protein